MRVILQGVKQKQGDKTLYDMYVAGPDGESISDDGQFNIGHRGFELNMITEPEDVPDDGAVLFTRSNVDTVELCVKFGTGEVVVLGTSL